MLLLLKTETKLDKYFNIKQIYLLIQPQTKADLPDHLQAGSSTSKIVVMEPKIGTF